MTPYQLHDKLRGATLRCARYHFYYLKYSTNWVPNIVDDPQNWKRFRLAYNSLEFFLHVLLQADPGARFNVVPTGECNRNQTLRLLKLNSIQGKVWRA